MGEHRRRAHQEMLEIQETPVQESQEETALQQTHDEHVTGTVHRRRTQAVQAELAMLAEQPAHQEQPAQPEPVADEENSAAKIEPKVRRAVSGHKKATSGKKMKKAPKKKKKGGLFRGVQECLLGVAVLLGAVGQAALTWISKARNYALKIAERLKGKKLPLRAMAMAFLFCVALVSAWQIASIALRSVRTRRLNEELSQQRAQLAEAAQSQEEEAQWVVYEGETIPAQEALAMLENLSTPMPERLLMPELTPVPVEPRTDAPRENQVNVVTTTKYRHLGGDALPEMAALRQQNSDLVAWMQIPDVLDLPVVYRDNDYYLTHDFNKKNNKSGTVFLDEDHPFKEKTQNLLLHGHNMKDGTMFGRLAQYLYDDSYLRNHPFVYFDTLWRKEQYVIFAVLDVSLDPTDGRFFNYFTHDTFSNDAAFEAYIRQLQLRSEYAIPIDVQPSDALLTLSTCLDEDRLVIVARRLREDETRSELRTFIRMATRQ